MVEIQVVQGGGGGNRLGLKLPKTPNLMLDGEFHFWNRSKPDQMVGFRKHRQVSETDKSGVRA